MTYEQGTFRRGGKFGLEYFKNWPAGEKGFTDIDAVSHNAATNNFVFFETKAFGKNVERSQELTLLGLSKLPGCICIFIPDYDADNEDHCSDNPDWEPLPTDELYRVKIYNNGDKFGRSMTLADVVMFKDHWLAYGEVMA